MATEAPLVVNYFTGEDKALTFTVLQSDLSTPQNISGWALSWMVKRVKTDADADALVTKTTSSGIVLTGPTNGICTVTIAEADIAVFKGETLYYHELKRTDTGLKTVLSFGKFILTQAVHDA